MSVSDARKAPFVWASVAALDWLRDRWDDGEDDAGVRMYVGRSVYYGLCELANEDRARVTVHVSSEKFKATRARICEKAGASDKTVDLALRELERIGLLHIERAESNGANAGTASFYMLLEPGETSGVAPHVEGSDVRSSSARTSGVAPHVDDEGAELVRRSLISQETHREGNAKQVDPELILGPLAEVATLKGGDVNPAAVARAIDAYPDRDHEGEADAFLGWHRGAGSNAPIKDVARGFRNWLQRSTGKRRPKLKAIEGGGDGGSSPYGKKVVRSGNDD